ncbi:Formin like protein [Phytophthora megakarya]|uniref:Formin like protein n=1 Tax=Phytophthora megakarya TaxID=4795 RepID=A0A225WUH8_9STRA|nr:Formin like protein [Phytophthora megakarya]
MHQIRQLTFFTIQIPPAPTEDQVQLRFNEFLLSVSTDPELRDELNATESIQTKWACVVFKIYCGSIAEEWLNARECVELIRRFRDEVKCVPTLCLAIRISIMLRPSTWVEKLVLEKGPKELVALLQMPGGASVEICNEVLSTLFVLTNSSVGISALLNVPECCNQGEIDEMGQSAKPELNSTSTNSNAETSSLHNIFSQLHQHTKNLDQETTDFIGADIGRSTDSSAARGAKLSLPFFQSSRKGPSLGVTPACTPIATASVRKDAKRPVFPSIPSPPRKDIPTSSPLTQATPPTETSIPPPAPSFPPIEMTAAIPPLETVKPLVIEQDSTNDTNAVHPAATGTDISKFRKLLSMGAPREAVRAKMQQAGVNPDLLDEQQGFTPKSSPRPTRPVEKGVPEVTKEVSAEPDVSKFRKLLSMGAPLDAVKGKMRQAGLDPSLLDTKSPSVEVREPTPTPSQPEALSGPDISKFKKLLTMGAPLAAVKAKMTQAGLNPQLLDGPSATTPSTSATQSVAPEKRKIKDDPSYAKFFKLLSMGAPAAAVKAKMVQAGLNSELLDTPDADITTTSAPTEFTSSAPETSSNSRALLSNMIASRASPPPVPQVKVKDDPQYAKFFKLLSMGAPAESVKAKMRMAGLQPEFLDTPDAPLKPESNASEAATPQPAVKVKDDPAYAKFFKLLSMGAPAESVKAKLRMAGLNPDLLDTPDAPVPNANAPVIATKATVKVKDDPSYAKFFKLLSMGAPAESVKTKMQMAGLKPELLDTPEADLPNAGNQALSQPQVKVKDDPAYSKFFKLLEMGAPADSVKAKMRMAGLQGDLLDTPDAFLPSVAPATGVAPSAPPAPTTTAARRAHLSIAIKPVNKAKTRSFYWQHLKDEAIKGTIWAELEKEHSNQSNQDLLTLTESELELLETEFPPPVASGPPTGRRGGGVSGLASPGGPASPLTSPRVVFLIDRARSNNISIIVKQFRMSNATLRVAIMKMDSEVLTLDRVQGLIKILPTEEEVAAIMGFSGDPSTLNGAELVLKELITVPRLKQRLAALETKHQFPALVRDLHTKINKIRVASNEIAQSSELKTILLVILQVGNKMNHGTARGGAKGFRLIDLTKLVQLKSVDKSVTLLHYVARMVRLKKGNTVRLGDSLASLYDVQSIPIPELLGDMNRINDLTESINVELAAQRLKNRIEQKEDSDLFVESMTAFVDEASKEVITLKEDLDETLRVMRDTMVRFDKSTEEEEAPAPASDDPITPAVLAGAGEFFSVIYEFTMSLTKADRENELKRIREEKRLKQQELKNATPRGARTKLNEKAAGPETNKPQTNVASKADESQPQTNVDAELEDKVESKPTGIPNMGLKVPLTKGLSLPSGEASPLKKVIGTKPTGIPSPMKVKRSASSPARSAGPAIPFDAASLNEIKSQLKTKHATNNGPQLTRGLKPEVEAEADDDNNNNEPTSPETTLPEAEPSARMVV